MKRLVFLLSILLSSLLLTDCSESEIKEICLQDEEVYTQFMYATFDGNEIDSLGRNSWDLSPVCQPFEISFPRTPIDVYEVEYRESTNCPCLFVESLSAAYCEIPFEEKSGTYTLDNNTWDVLYAFRGDTIFHPPCELPEIHELVKMAGRVAEWDENEFVIASRFTFVSGSSKSYLFSELDRASQTMNYLGFGGTQSQAAPDGDAMERKVAQIFREGDRLHHYQIEGNLLYLTKPDSTSGMVFVAR